MGIKIVIDFGKEITNRTMFMFLEKTDRRDLLPSLEMFGPVWLGGSIVRTRTTSSSI